MAKIPLGILCKTIGSLGSVNTYSFYGTNCIRFRPGHRKYSSSPKQIIVRSQFLSVNSFLSVIYPSIVSKTLFSHSLSISPWFRFMRFNYHFFDSYGLSSPSSLITSFGTLAPFQDFALNFITGRKLAFFSWLDNSDYLKAFPNDIFSGFIYNSHLRSIQFFTLSAIRSDQSIQIQLPSNWLSGHHIFVYASFLKYNNLCCSNNISYDFVM